MEENQSTGSAPDQQGSAQNESTNAGTGASPETGTTGTGDQKPPEDLNTGQGENLGEEITAGTEVDEKESAQQRDTGNLVSDGILKD